MKVEKTPWGSIILKTVREDVPFESNVHPIIKSRKRKHRRITTPNGVVITVFGGKRENP